MPETFDPRKGAIERFQEVKDYPVGPSNENQIAVLGDEGLSLEFALSTIEWLTNYVVPSLQSGFDRLYLLGYNGPEADVRAFVGPDNVLAISLSGVRYADVGTAILNENPDLFNGPEDVVGGIMDVPDVGPKDDPDVGIFRVGQPELGWASGGEAGMSPTGPVATADGEVSQDRAEIIAESARLMVALESLLPDVADGLT